MKNGIHSNGDEEDGELVCLQSVQRMVGRVEEIVLLGRIL